MRIIAVLPLVCGLALAQAPAPAPQPSQAVIRAGTQEVLLDLVVRDKKGKLVRDLKSEEVEVYDEGARQKITGFRLVTGADPAALPGEPVAGPKPLDPLRQLRLVTLVFEGMGVQERRLARDAGLDLLRQELEPNVLISVFIIDQRLHILQQFTNDRELLKQAVQRATGGNFLEFQQRSEAIRKELAAARTGAGAADQAFQSTPAPGRGSGGNSAIASAAAQAKIAEMTLSILNFSDSLFRTEASRSSIYSLMALVREQAALPGRKTLVYFTPGLNVTSSMAEQFKDAIALANRSGVSVYGVDPRGVILENQNAAATDMLNEATSATARDTSGQAPGASMHSFETARDAIHGNVQESLATLAVSTGGVLIANTNDLRGPLQRIREDVLTYYELAYNPQLSDFDGRFRRLQVRVTRPNTVVQARNGYFALPPASESVANFETPLLHALGSADLPKDFRMQVSALRFWKKPDGKIAHTIVVEVPHKELTFVEEPANRRHRAHISFIAVVKDEQGQIVDRFSRDLGFYADADKLDAFKQRNFVGMFHLGLAPGRYTIEAAAMDRENTRTTARRSAVIVPPVAAGVAVSSISFVRGTPGDAGPAEDDPFQFQGKRLLPTFDNVIQSGVDPGFSLYLVVTPAAASAGGRQLVIELSKDGQALGKTASPLPEPDAQGLIRHMFALPFAKFPPGQYELALTAVDGGSQAQSRVNFVVQ